MKPLMTRLHDCLFAVGLLVPGAAHAQTEPTYDQLIGKSRAALAAGQLQEAFVLASAAQIKDARRWQAPFLAGAALSANNNHLDAVRYVEQAIAKAPASRKSIISVTLKEERQKAQVQRDKLTNAKPVSLSTEDSAASDAMDKIAGNSLQIQHGTCGTPKYPPADLRNEVEGTVVMLFVVRPDGTVSDIRIVRTSGSPTLDESARVAMSMCRFNPAPKGFKKQRSMPTQFKFALQ